MTGTITRLLAGAALTAAVVVSSSAPVLAAQGHAHAVGHHKAPATSRSVSHPASPAPGLVDIGTAAAWVRGADGSIHRVR